MSAGRPRPVGFLHFVLVLEILDLVVRDDTAEYTKYKCTKPELASPRRGCNDIPSHNF